MQRFNEIMYAIPEFVSPLLRSLPESIKHSTYEIRLRSERPVALSTESGTIFIGQGGVNKIYSTALPKATADDINECFVRLCEHSVYSYEQQIRRGFIPMRHGHRAGICGTAVYGDSGLITFKDISAVNIRIARQINGCADPVMRIIGGKPCSLIISGAPGTGKTTVLRDLARQLSMSLYRVAVIDERSEIAAMARASIGNDLGPCCDVINGCEKAYGIQIAVRTLAPQVIMFDEIGSADEAAAVKESLHCGVPVITTLHSGNVNEALLRLKNLELDKEFETIVQLAGTGRIESVFNIGELAVFG